MACTSKEPSLRPPRTRRSPTSLPGTRCFWRNFFVSPPSCRCHGTCRDVSADQPERRSAGVRVR
eukprot:12879955-Prorocentrum_lima.AAC.1